MFLCTQTARAAAAPALSAASAILVDGDTGRVLFENNAHDKRLIASITKLMTALVVVESTPDLTQTVEIQREWTLAEGSSMYLKPGEVLTLETFLYGLLLSSGNDAALALAGACAGDVETFVEWMNGRAESLGMENTHFVNPNGLNHEDHYSTAHDMALLARECLKYPVLEKIMTTRSTTREGHSFTNHNKLLWRYEGCVGMKTGYTQLAGRTLVSAAKRNGQTLICVTLSDPNDWEDHTAMLDYGFKHYPRQVLALKGRHFRSVQVSGSLVSRVGVEISHDIYYPVHAEEPVRAVIQLPETVEAPVKAGSVAGSLSFWIGEEEIGRTYLLYSQSVRRDLAKPWLPFGRAIAFLRGETIRLDHRYSAYAV
jgi:D-alanyl-D-alanine carboxypeptidase